MTAGRYTSRVFVVGETIKAALESAQIPDHPVTGDCPQVEFSDEEPDEGNESIAIALNTDATQTEWRRLSPPGRDEDIAFDVIARSFVPCGFTSAEVWDRLEDLSAAIESIVYDTTTESVVGLGFDGEVDVARVAAVRPSVFPTNQGWMGAVVVSFACRAQI